MTLGGVVDANQDVARMSEAVDECFETPLSCLSAEELSDRLVAINNASARFDALRVETVAAAKAANVGTLNDQRNVANHVAERTNTNPADTRADQLIADWLTDFPELASAYRRGVMTTAHVNLLRRKDNPRVHSQLIDDQHKFVQWFRDIAFRDLDAVIERWLLGADPDGAEPKEHATECGLSLKPLPGGLLAVNGVLDPLMGHALKTAVHAKAKKIRARHKAAGISSTVRRRNLEALMLLVTTGYASEHDITLNPLVSIVTDQHTPVTLRVPSSFLAQGLGTSRHPNPRHLEKPNPATRTNNSTSDLARCFASFDQLGGSGGSSRSDGMDGFPRDSSSQRPIRDQDQLHNSKRSGLVRSTQSCRPLQLRISFGVPHRRHCERRSRHDG